MLIGSVAGEFVIEPTKVPCFVRDVVCEFEPTVRNTHCKTEVEGASTFFLGGADSRETRDIFGNGEGLGADGVDELVGKGEIGKGI